MFNTFGLRRPLAAILLLASVATAPAYADWQDTLSRGFPLAVPQDVPLAVPLSAPLVTALQPVSDQLPIHIAVSLQLQNRSQLDAYLAMIQTPGNALYGDRLTPEQFAAQYSPTTAQAQAVMNYLSDLGFTNVQLAVNRVLVTADGDAATAKRAFNTRMGELSINGARVFANLDTLQVPDTLGGVVVAVLGLNNLNPANTLLVPYAASAAAPTVNVAYGAAQFRTAYHVANTPDGSDTAIAIVSAGSDLQQVIKDLRTFEAISGLPQVPVTIQQVSPLPSPLNASNDVEWALDSQAATGIAGYAKELIFYNATDLSAAALLPAFNQFVIDNRARIGNMSFGSCEPLNAWLGTTAAVDQAYAQAVAQGQTWFAASGDAGSSCAAAVNLGLPQSGPAGVIYPASSPYVVAVGGTSLITDNAYNYLSESAWGDSGGGNSSYEGAPTWQRGSVASSATGLRGLPDIAMDADPKTGAAIIVNGKSLVVGGTSLASPLAAGVWARLQTAHGNQLGFAAPLIYALNTVGGGTPTANGFHDVVAGSNGLYAATPGWDYTTGFGSFDISAVNAGLSDTPATTPTSDAGKSAVGSSSPSPSTSSGSGGGAFGFGLSLMMASARVLRRRA